MSFGIRRYHRGVSFIIKVNQKRDNALSERERMPPQVSDFQVVKKKGHSHCSGRMHARALLFWPAHGR